MKDEISEPAVERRKDHGERRRSALDERKQAEAELRHDAELLDLGDAFLELDREWRVVRVNANQERLSRRTRAETLGRTVWELWPETAAADSCYWIEYHRCMDERVPVQFEEYFAPLELWTGVTAYPTSRGGIAVFFRDVSARRRAEEAREHALQALERANEELRRADRRKNDFLAMLSHELRNPLAPILNGVYILERTAPGSDSAVRARQVIERQARHMARLVDDLLDLTRIARGKIRLQRQPVLLNALAQAVAEDHRELFARERVELEVRDGGGPLAVDGDPTRLAQAIGNLLSNAAKFTPAGGRARIDLDAREGLAVVRVSDTGVGLDPDALERIFDPFTQAEATLDRSRSGLGLGLALVRALVRMHGGEISASSPGPGQGSTFTIQLPLAGPATAERERAPG